MGRDAGASHGLSGAPSGEGADAALLALLDHLKGAGYAFVTPTPSTHALVRRRSAASDEDLLRDVFGWVRPFRAEQMPAEVLVWMQAAEILHEDEGGLVSRLRVSTLDDRLHLHSAPTSDNDAVFLGPDSYRYVRLLRQEAPRAAYDRALDIGVGAGAGALALLAMRPEAEVWGSDVNPLALRLAALNAAHGGLNLRTVQASGLPDAPERFDLIIANPPYIAGDVGKTYRDGGDDRGAALGLSWVRAGVERLAPGGRFILYTGAPIVRGRDIVRQALADLATQRELSLSYEEIDPDVFGNSLKASAYQDVERIAAVGAVLTAR